MILPTYKFFMSYYCGWYFLKLNRTAELFSSSHTFRNGNKNYHKYQRQKDIKIVIRKLIDHDRIRMAIYGVSHFN